MLAKNRRQQLRDEALDKYGGKCEICGFSKYKSALEFHHVLHDGKFDRHNPIKRYKEILIDKNEYKLLCANCHAAITHGEIPNPKQRRTSED